MDLGLKKLYVQKAPNLSVKKQKELMGRLLCLKIMIGAICLILVNISEFLLLGNV